MAKLKFTNPAANMQDWSTKMIVAGFTSDSHLRAGETVVKYMVGTTHSGQLLQPCSQTAV